NRHVAVRKGRENYICLLNFQEAAGLAALGGRGADPVTMGLIARWIRYSRDGDVVGGDFPAWLGGMDGLTDRRGECLHAACPHYRKCPIERAARRARQARVVVANHALVLSRAAQDLHLPPDASEGERTGEPPTHLIFDEGHHLFDAADSAFSSHLTGTELSELRRWVRGPEARGRLRVRGLSERIGDLVDDLPDGPELIRKAQRAAAGLPGPGWQGRLRQESPAGPCEAFLAALRAHVLEKAEMRTSGAQMEAEIHPATDELIRAAGRCADVLLSLEVPLADLARGLRAAIGRAADADAPDYEPATLNRMEAAARALDRRAYGLLAGWRRMLSALEEGTPEAFVDWASLDFAFGRLMDAGLHRHHVDPMAPLAAHVYGPAKGVVVTSATLRDAPDEPGTEDPDGWQAASARLGARHLSRPPVTASVPSPFDYGARTRVFVLTDVGRDDAGEVATALAELFTAAGGGAVGLFTAIRRLKAVWKELAPRLADSGLPLFAQHVDAMDTGTLVDVFREETDSCLLGTDAVRDGIDVQGRSLRLMALDRVPWPRPDILHKARRARGDGRSLDDQIVRLRLKQAYGRLIRHEDDRGVFVVLDRRTPSRLLAALPPGVGVARVPLAEATAEIRAFLALEGARGEKREARGLATK
ncbi:MAG: ATP-dependent DNA helicase, partial [Alphaproteobacteria bacterium]